MVSQNNANYCTALDQEPISWSLQLKAYVTAFLQTDLFLVYLFFPK